MSDDPEKQHCGSFRYFDHGRRVWWQSSAERDHPRRGRGAVRAVTRKQTPTEWRLIYDAFLRSPSWTEKRDRIMTRAHSICECCLHAAVTQVHHVTYPQPLTLDALAKQPNWQLRAICNDCHERVHDR